MIHRKDVAETISKLMLELLARLNDSVELIQKSSSHAEFVAYRMAAGRIMGDLVIEVMNPLYAEHPDLKPPGID